MAGTPECGELRTTSAATPRQNANRCRKSDGKPRPGDAMTPKTPKFPEVFRTAEEEATAAELLCRFIVDVGFVGHDESVTEVGMMDRSGVKVGRFVVLEEVEEPEVCCRYLYEGQDADGQWKVVVRSEGEHPNIRYSFDQVEGNAEFLRDFLEDG
jgi:hypothetical protein